MYQAKHCGHIIGSKNTDRRDNPECFQLFLVSPCKKTTCSVIFMKKVQILTKFSFSPIWGSKPLSPFFYVAAPSCGSSPPESMPKIYADWRGDCAVCQIFAPTTEFSTGVCVYKPSFCHHGKLNRPASAHIRPSTSHAGN